MTAKELIEELKKYPEDTKVYLDYKWPDPNLGIRGWHETEKEIIKVFDFQSLGEVHLSTYEYALCPDGI